MFLPLEYPQIDLDPSIKQECDSAIKKCIQCIIALSRDRKPIKKADLNRMAFSDTSREIKSSLYSKLVQTANVGLSKRFGWRLYELDDKLRYILVCCNGLLGDTTNLTPEDYKELTLLFIILSRIFVSNDEQASFQNIVDVLAIFEMSDEEIKTYIQGFVKSMYLIEVKEQEERLYRWGPRSRAEVDPDEYFEKLQKFLENEYGYDEEMLANRIATLRSIAGR